MGLRGRPKPPKNYVRRTFFRSLGSFSVRAGESRHGVDTLVTVLSSEAPFQFECPNGALMPGDTISIIPRGTEVAIEELTFVDYLAKGTPSFIIEQQSLVTFGTPHRAHGKTALSIEEDGLHVRPNRLAKSISADLTMNFASSTGAGFAQIYGIHMKHVALTSQSFVGARDGRARLLASFADIGSPRILVEAWQEGDFNGDGVVEPEEETAGGGGAGGGMTTVNPPPIAALFATGTGAPRLAGIDVGAQGVASLSFRFDRPVGLQLI